MENTIYSNDSSEESDGSDHSDYEILPPSIENHSSYYRQLLGQLRPDLVQIANNYNIDVDPKPKKKNVSQMGRRKANRALNGINYLYKRARLTGVKYLLYCEYRSLYFRTRLYTICTVCFFVSGSNL